MKIKNCIDELPLNFPLEGINVSARRLAHESLLFAKKNNLFEDYRHYSESCSILALR